MLALTVTASRSRGLEDPFVTCNVSATPGPLSSPGPWPTTVTSRAARSTVRAAPPTVTVVDGAAGGNVLRAFDGTGVSDGVTVAGCGEATGADEPGDDAVGAAEDVVDPACPEPPEQPVTTSAVVRAPPTSPAVLRVMPGPLGPTAAAGPAPASPGTTPRAPPGGMRWCPRRARCSRPGRRSAR